MILGASSTVFVEIDTPLKPKKTQVSWNIFSYRTIHEAPCGEDDLGDLKWSHLESKDEGENMWSG